MRRKSGVSLIVLVITIIVMIILASVVIYASSDTSNNAKMAAFASDLESIEDLVKEYYVNSVEQVGYNTLKLPYGYTKLEYIESTGTQYINTNYIPKQNTKVEVDFKSTKVEGELFTTLFGTQKNTAEGRFYVMFGGNNNLQVNIPRSGDGYAFLNNDGTFERATQSNKPYWTSARVVYSASISDKAVIIGNNFWDISSYFNQQYIDPTYPLCVLTRNNAGTPDSRCSKGLLYEVCIYETRNLVKKLVPCKNSSNVVGMYDLVNNVFYTNAGEGSFIAGEDILDEDGGTSILPIDTESDTYNKATLTALITDGKSDLSDEIEANGDDDAIFYVIDLDKLSIQNTKRGNKEDGNNDIYVVSDKNLNVYYLQGEKIAKEYYFSLSERLTGKSKVNSSNVADISSISITNTTSGIKLTKSTADWTKNLTVTVDTDLEEGETLSYKIADEVIGATTGTINVSEVLAANETVRNKFYLSNANKKVTVQKLNDSSEVIAEATINVANLDILAGDIASASITHTKYNKYTLASVSGYADQGGSGVKEIRIIYTKNSEDEAYYDNLPATVTSTYIYNSGKTSAPTIIKMPSDVSEYKIIFIDNAGNVSEIKTVEIED